jgi:hypothetical protein
MFAEGFTIPKPDLVSLLDCNRVAGSLASAQVREGAGFHFFEPSQGWRHTHSEGLRLGVGLGAFCGAKAGE